MLVFQVEAEVGAQLSRPWGVGAAAEKRRARGLRHEGGKPSLWRPEASIPAYPAYIP